MKCEMNGCLTEAGYFAVYGCFEGDIYTRRWCRPDLISLLGKVGTGRWRCAGSHAIMDLIYQPINWHEYTIDGFRQVMDYQGHLVR